MLSSVAALSGTEKATGMNENTQQLSENRTKADAAFLQLVSESREIVYRLIKPVADQGKFSLDDVAPDSRGNIRTLDDIAQTTDPAALLGVLSAALNGNDGPPALSIPGISYRFVDKVRNFRNDFAHFEPVFSDSVYVQDNIKAVNDLREGLVGVQARLPASQYKPSPNPRVRPSKPQPRPRVRHHEPSYGRGVGQRGARTRPRPIYPEFVSTPTWQTEAIKRKVLEQTSMGNSGWADLHAAALNGYVEAANNLILRSDDLNAKDSYGWTPLHVAAELGHTEIVKQLISAGARLNTQNTDGWTPMNVAAAHDQTEIVKQLNSAGARPNMRNTDGRTALYTAAASGHLEIVMQLITAGANLGLADNEGWTPLHVAAQNGHLEIVNQLISAGAVIDSTSNIGWTPLHNAAKYGQPMAVKELLDSGALIDARNNEGKTPGQLATGRAISAFASRTKIAGKPQYYLINLGFTLFSPALPMTIAIISVHLVALAFGPSSIVTSGPFLGFLAMLLTATTIWGVFQIAQVASGSYASLAGTIRDDTVGNIILLALSIPVGFLLATAAYFTIASMFPESWATGISTGVGGLMTELARVAPNWQIDYVGFDLPASIEAGGYWIQHLGSRLVATLILFFGILMLLMGLMVRGVINISATGRKNEELLLAKIGTPSSTST